MVHQFPDGTVTYKEDGQKDSTDRGEDHLPRFSGHSSQIFNKVAGRDTFECRGIWMKDTG